MKPLKLSSGDLLADRRADYAEMLFSTGDVAAAFEPLRDALELAPDWAMGWYRLGEMLEAAGMPEQAAEAWRRTLALEPDDRPGAALKLELIGQAPPSSAPPGGRGSGGRAPTIPLCSIFRLAMVSLRATSGA